MHRSSTTFAAMLVASGASALLFESLFFRLAALVFGSSVLAATLVLCGFMAGLALGNLLAGRLGDDVASPLRALAAIELAIGAVGQLVVVALPGLAAMLAPVFVATAGSSFAQDLLRFAIALLLLLLPTTAMGMTLPLVVVAGHRRDPNFGAVLGRLYGWNTAGGIVGVLAGEGLLVPWLGVSATAAVAGGLHLLAALAALFLSRGAPAAGTRAVRAPGNRTALLASLACGAVLLALEVVWFRFYVLFFPPYGWTFASMLAIVLAGIAAGGFVGGRWFRSRPERIEIGVPVALASGGLQCFVLLALAVRSTTTTPAVAEMVALMFPISALSGVLFTVCGRAVDLERGLAGRSAGEIATANTIGGAIGAVLGGLFFLPVLGIERSMFVLALAYGIIALLLDRMRRGSLPASRLPTVAATTFFLGGLALFPWGSIETVFLARPGSLDRDLAERGLERVAFREGRNETIRYLRQSLLDRPWRHSLLTNVYSMSGTSAGAKRYMKLFVYWPVAVHPDLRDALLISYGVGNTAKALTDTSSLRSIDIVDLSREILELSSVVYPDRSRSPLGDPRVRVFVEDGRFHLQTTRADYDLITAEPPPPRVSGVHNLYTREFFELVRDRLRPGGIVTYWLPVHELLPAETKSVIRGFCDAFPTCSLWAGMDTHWMLVGIREPLSAARPEEFSRQWSDPVVGPEMRRLGFPDPESFGAFFIADGPRLDRFVGDAPPLTDDQPGRISSRYLPVDARAMDEYHSFARPAEAEAGFRGSSLVRAIWPEEFRRAALERFELGRRLNLLLKEGSTYENLHAALTTPALRDVIPWALGSDGDAIEILDSIPDLDRRQAELATDLTVHHHLLAHALGRGDIASALSVLEAAIEHAWHTRRHVLESSEQLRLYLLAFSGRSELAVEGIERLRTRLGETGRGDGETGHFAAWLARTFPAFEGAGGGGRNSSFRPMRPGARRGLGSPGNRIPEEATP